MLKLHNALLRQSSNRSAKFMHKNKKGFSLIELVIVIAILAVLAAVLAPALIHYVEDSRATSDIHSMDEVVNAVQIGLANPEAYDEMVDASVDGNVACYIDSSSESGRDKEIVKVGANGTAYYTFDDDNRLLDEVPYTAAGNMRGVTITFIPNTASENLTYDVKNAVINKHVGGTALLSDYPNLYNRVRQTIGDTITLDSQTYGNSEYTIFIRIGSGGGSQATAQDPIQVYGQYNGTNLPKSYTSGGTAADRDDTYTPPTNTNPPSGGGTGTGGTPVTPPPPVGGGGTGGNQETPTQPTDPEPTEPEPETNPALSVLSDPGLYNADNELIVAWSDLLNMGFDITVDCTANNYSSKTTSLKYVWNKNSAALSGSTQLVIPSGVTKIGSNVFRECRSLTNIIIPDTVTLIGDYAFCYCANLGSIDLPDNLKVISQGMLYGCWKVTDIQVGSKVTTIKDYGFIGCSIETINLPASVTSIGSQVFEDCNDLIAINVNAANSKYMSVDGVLYTKNQDTLIRYPSAKSGTSFTMPNTVKTLPRDAFGECSNLKNLILSSNLTSIGAYAFDHSALTSMTIPDSVTSIGSSLFWECNDLTSVILGNGITNIPSSLFSSCDNLTQVTLPSGLTKIDNTAFDSCKKLTSITIPSGVKYIGANAFRSCTSLTSVNFITQSGWYVTTDSSKTTGTSVNVSDQNQAAQALVSDHSNKYWKRN